MSTLIADIKGFADSVMGYKHYLKYVGAALLTGTVTWAIDFRRVQRDRTSRCVELSKDFTSPDFLPIRNRASAVLVKVYKSGTSEIEKSSPEDFNALTALSGFYQHVGISFTENTVKRRLVLKYFSSNFVWWYVNFFSIPEGPIAKNWGAGPPVEQLYKDLQTLASKADWKTWHTQAEDAKRVRIASIKGTTSGPVPIPAQVPTTFGAAWFDLIAGPVPIPAQVPTT
jgi:hypothetical protein